MERYGEYHEGDGHDDLSALDFSSYGDTPDVEDDDSTIGALDQYSPAEAHDEPDPLAPYIYTVTNPYDSVSVSAVIGGRIHQVELSPAAVTLTESELTEEILVLADLAKQKALAGQTAFLADSEVLADGMRQMGLDSGDVVRDFMENGLGFPSAQKVQAAQAEVFATRYARDDD